jgi:hypothetical protein
LIGIREFNFLHIFQFSYILLKEKTQIGIHKVRRI